MLVLDAVLTGAAGKDQAPVWPADPELPALMQTTCLPRVVDDTVDLQLLQKAPARALLPVLRHVDGWSEAKAGDITLRHFSGAMTNVVFGCSYTRPDGQVLRALARVFGSSVALFDRDDEQATFMAVAASGLGPKLLVAWEIGRIEEFLDATTLTAGSIRRPALSRGIAATMADFHFSVPGQLPAAPLKPQLWRRLRTWHRMALELCGAEGLAAQGLTKVAAQIDALEAKLTREHPFWMCFAHNDLQYGNIMQRRSATSEPATSVAAATSPAAALEAPEHAPAEPAAEPAAAAPSANGAAAAAGHAESLADMEMGIKLIDYEYAGPNPVAYDIANHWCEWAADYHTPTPHVLDFSRLPSEAEQRSYVEAYVDALPLLHSRLQQQGRLDSLAVQLGEHPLLMVAANASAHSRAKLVESLHHAALAYMTASHLGWGLWGFIQAKVSDIDFDFMEYGHQRIVQYLASSDCN